MGSSKDKPLRTDSHQEAAFLLDRIKTFLRYQEETNPIRTKKVKYKTKSFSGDLGTYKITFLYEDDPSYMPLGICDRIKDKIFGSPKRLSFRKESVFLEKYSTNWGWDVTKAQLQTVWEIVLEKL